ncbi:MAG: HAMP domain-containing sensor histidine kinase [Dehalococcoidia bacterium]|nr:HAMP domain-containing histidine kinase [Dehalococcoidia bacterium]MCB9484892.1 HAMP domain-containing histidine kinase [Thermoflexaceae bacterium]
MRLLDRLSIRTKITASIFGVTTTLLIAMSVAVYIAFQVELRENLDDTLRQRAVPDVRLVSFEGEKPVLSLESDAGEERAEGEAVLRLYDRAGVVVADGTPLVATTSRESSAVAKAIASGNVQKISVDPEGADRYRYRVTPIFRDGVVAGAIVTGLDDSTVAEPLGLLRTILLVTVPITAAAVAGGSFLIAQRALRPIDRITATAAEIGEGRLDRRIKENAVDDEVGRLGRTFNRMIGRLSALVERERQFTSDAAHELRTPLAAIEASIDVTLSRERDGEDYRRTLDAVHAQAQRMTRLTTQLLALARMDAASVDLTEADVDLEQLTQGVALQAGERYPGLVVAIDAEPLTMRGSEDLLGQALLNLVENAALHAKGATRVEVLARGTNGEVFLSVSDDGPGIPEDLHAAVFERFRQLDASRTERGTGLGLAIVKAVAELHGGWVTVTSPGRLGGATFEIRIPARNIRE